MVDISYYLTTTTEKQVSALGGFFFFWYNYELIDFYVSDVLQSIAIILLVFKLS